MDVHNVCSLTENDHFQAYWDPGENVRDQTKLVSGCPNCENAGDVFVSTGPQIHRFNVHNLDGYRHWRRCFTDPSLPR
jgi:hypothetical protein